MAKIIIDGACGKMGSRVVALATQDKELEIVGLIEAPTHPAIGKELLKGLFLSSDLYQSINKADVVIEFTTPEATIEHIKICHKANKAIVIATTGLSAEQTLQVNACAKDIPVLMSPNMSTGVNLLFKLVELVAKTIPNYDIEIVELHHNLKKDAPSGTAIKLAKIISKVLGRDLDLVGTYGRKGIIGARKTEEIGIHAIRAGDIVGEHTVIFAGTGERIELTHRAHSRDTFAAGALLGAKWLVKQKPGLYDMKDVLAEIVPL